MVINYIKDMTKFLENLNVLKLSGESVDMEGKVF